MVLPAPHPGVYEIVGAAGLGLASHHRRSELTRFVGRETEFEALRYALARAAGGHGPAVAIVGEPGVGKTPIGPFPR